MLERFVQWAMDKTFEAIGLFLAAGTALTALGFAAWQIAVARAEFRRKNGAQGDHTAELAKDLAALTPPRQQNSDPLQRLVTFGELSEAIEGVRRELRAVIQELTASRERLAVKVEALPGEIRAEVTAVLEGWIVDSEKRSQEVREQLADVLAAHGIIERRKTRVPVEVDRRAKKEL